MSAGALAGSIAVYALFAGTEPGRRADAAILRRDLDWGWEWPAHVLAASASRPAITFAVTVLCAVALLDRRPGDAARAIVLVAASALLSRLGEDALIAADPLAVESMRPLGPGWYPSGHAAATLSIGLAALLVAPARARGPALLVVTAVWPAMVGWAIVADGGHHVSDVAGGWLLAAAVAGALAAGRRDRGHARCRVPWPAVVVVIGGPAAAAVLVAAVDDLQVAHSLLQPALIGIGVPLATMTLGLTHAFDRTLTAESPGPR